DAYGNNSTVGLPSSLDVTVSLDSGTGPLQGTKTLDIGTGAGNGTVTYTDLEIDSSGSKTLRAVASGMTDAVSDSFTVSPDVADAAATHAGDTGRAASSGTATFADLYIASSGS